MSNSISIVPKISTYPQNKDKALEIIDWLVSKDIVKPELSDCILDKKGGFAISNGAKHIVKESEFLPYDLITNGLEVITERQVFITGENFPEKVICPSCKANIFAEEWDVNPWAENVSDTMLCPSCGKDNNIHDYHFDWEWGFSDLGFVFWNWTEFKEEFIEEFKEKLNCEINIVYCRW